LRAPRGGLTASTALSSPHLSRAGRTTRGRQGTRVINTASTLEPVTALKPHPRNVNEGDLGAILESINENGFYGSIVAQRSTGFILAGNHRYQAAVQAGASEVPVTWVDVDDARALRILLADNRTTRLGRDDQEALTLLLQELARDGGLAGTGYDGDDLDDLLKELNTEPPEVQDLSANFTGKLEVAVTCESESQQRELYERLTGEGYECRVLTL
jgi:ParB-like chromosome segregation protein Spo0J